MWNGRALHVFECDTMVLREEIGRLFDCAIHVELSWGFEIIPSMMLSRFRKTLRIANKFYLIRSRRSDSAYPFVFSRKILLPSLVPGLKLPEKGVVFQTSLIGATDKSVAAATMFLFAMRVIFSTWCSMMSTESGILVVLLCIHRGIQVQQIKISRI